MDSEKVTELLQPTIAIISWQPSGIDWTLHCRAVERCREYILLGESDSSTCGDGWATWGIVPENGYEYGLDEDSIAPYKQEGFERVELPDVTEYMICRFDSHASRGFSKAVSFKRLKPEGEEEEESDLGASVVANEEGGETLEESWERMQRSLAAGKAEKGRDAFDRARKLLNPKLRVAESIEFKSATTPDGAPARPTAAPQS